jgi:hypothetical protein
VVFVSRGCLDALGRSVLSYEFLKTVGDPDVEHTNSTDRAEPGQRILHISLPVVPMTPEHRSDQYSPSNCFECVLEPENVLNSEGIVLDLNFLFVIFEEVFTWSLVILDITPPELMDLIDLLSVFFSSRIEVIQVCTSISGRIT